MIDPIYVIDKRNKKVLDIMPFDSIQDVYLKWVNLGYPINDLILSRRDYLNNYL